MAATKRICSGELTENDLMSIINAQSTSPKRIVASIDVYANGRVTKHAATEEEVIDFACKCEDLDKLVETMTSRREEYQKQVKRAEKAREEKAKKNLNEG